jgi:hypothetical protein
MVVNAATDLETPKRIAASPAVHALGGQLPRKSGLNPTTTIGQLALTTHTARVIGDRLLLCTGLLGQ